MNHHTQATEISWFFISRDKRPTYCYRLESRRDRDPRFDPIARETLHPSRGNHENEKSSVDPLRWDQSFFVGFFAKRVAAMGNVIWLCGSFPLYRRSTSSNQCTVRYTVWDNFFCSLVNSHFTFEQAASCGSHKIPTQSIQSVLSNGLWPVEAPPVGCNECGLNRVESLWWDGAIPVLGPLQGAVKIHIRKWNERWPKRPVNKELGYKT